MTAALPQSAPTAAARRQPLPVKEFGPEFNLLLACCADITEPERAERIRESLSDPIDETRLLDLAEHHGVLPQLYRHLSKVAASRLDIGPLRQRYEASARQAMWLTGELLRVLDHLRAQGIEALPHKGPVLSEILYGNVAMRQFSDLDVFVRAVDVPRAKATVIELGYESSLELTPRQERAYLTSGYEYTFDSSQGRNLLEIQWQVLPRFYSIDFKMDGFFERATEVRVGGQWMKTLGAEDMLLVLCVHASKHAWVQLSWLCDIAKLVKSKPIDWKIVQVEAKRLGIEQIVGVTFFLVRELLGTQFPMTERFEAAATTQAIAKIMPIISDSAEYNAESISYFRLMMQLRERRPDRARFLWRLVSTPGVGEWSAIRLPPSLFPLYRAVRYFRLVGKL